MSLKTKLVGAIQYFTLGVQSMKDYQQKHLEKCQKEQEIKDTIIRDILEKVEKNCRASGRLTYWDYGFDSTCFHTFEGSLQEKVIKELEDLGYKCIMSFNPSYLTVKGW